LEKWVQQLPARWARNAAIAMSCVFVLPVLAIIYYEQGDVASRTIMVGGSVFSAAIMAWVIGLVFWVIGLTARAALIRDNHDWDMKANLIVVWWSLSGAILFAVVPPALTYISLRALGHGVGTPSWRGTPMLQGPLASAVEGAILGLFTALVSRKGLRNALAKDRSSPTADCEHEMLPRLPKPVVIALAVVTAWFILPDVWTAFIGFLIGDGSELAALLLRLGLLVAVIVGSKPLLRVLKGSRPSLESVRTAGVAVAKTILPLARTIAGGTIRLFNALRIAVIYLRGCRWPKALIWFWLTFGIILLQSMVVPGIFLMLLGASFWSVVTINLGFAQLIAEPAMRKISPAWSLAGLAWFVGYAAVSIHGHAALDRLAVETATENSRQSLPFDPRTQSLVVVHSKIYGAPSAERFLMTYPLSVVYEEHEDARFTALRFGSPELCDTITANAPSKAAVTQHIKMTIRGAPFCAYTTIEAPDLPVVRLRFEQEELRIVGAEGHIDRTILTSGGDKRQVASVKAAPYRYLPLPVVGCYLGDGHWECSHEFLKENQLASPDDVALVGESLGLHPSSPASRSEQIYALGSAPLERAQNLGEAAAAAELDRLLANPTGSTAQLTLNILSARPYLIAGRTERLGVAAAEALITRGNWRDMQSWSGLMVALPEADFRQVGPSFVGAMLAQWTDASERRTAAISDRLIYRLADLGPTALPLLERIYQDQGAINRVASVVALCRLGAPAADLTERIGASLFIDRSLDDRYDLQMLEATMLALIRQGRGDLAAAGRQQYERWAAAVLRERGFTVDGWSKDFEEKSQGMTPFSSPEACMITRN
jgi:hypothetical protein